MQKDSISVKLCYRVYAYNNNYSITNNNYENFALPSNYKKMYVSELNIEIRYHRRTLQTRFSN